MYGKRTLTEDGERENAIIYAFIILEFKYFDIKAAYYLQGILTNQVVIKAILSRSKLL
jgi:hypothetical protein